MTGTLNAAVRQFFCRDGARAARRRNGRWSENRPSLPRGVPSEALEPRLLLAASLLKDLNEATESAFPHSLTDVNGTLFFAATDRGAGTELWKSDGTSAGTVRVADLLAGPDGSMPAELTNVAGRLFFATAGPMVPFPDPRSPTGGGLWVSDGTAAGTRRISDVAPDPRTLVAVGDRLLFSAYEPQTGHELWVSDGTPGGTRLLKDITPGYDYSNLLQSAVVWRGSAYFPANDGSHGMELWRSDGTEAGTRLVKDIAPGFGWAFESGGPYNLAVANNTLFFAATTPDSGTELWRTDGTEAGTVQVAELTPGRGSTFFADLSGVGPTLYFTSTANGTGYDLFKSDGTAAGTRLVKDVVPEAGTLDLQPSKVYELNGRNYFWAFSRLWRTDGTSAGTAPVTGAVEPQRFRPDVVVRTPGALYYLDSANGSYDVGVWRTDGTAAGTVRVGGAELVPSYYGGSLELAVSGGNVFFPGSQPAFGSELFKVSATSSGPAKLVKDINTATPYGSDPSGFVRAGERAYFLARRPDGRFQLAVTDGTSAGTHFVLDMGERWGREPSRMLAAGFDDGTILFYASDTGEIWRSDGTAAGTKAVTRAGPDFSGFVRAGRYAYFAVSGGTVYGRGLWKTDGTAAGTAMVTTVGYGDAMVAVGDILYFAGIDGPAVGGLNYELYRTDGTAAGTWKVKEISPDTGSYPGALTNIDGTLYFTATDGNFNLRSLYKTDGTAAGTVRLTSGNFPGVYVGNDPFVAVNGTVYFVAGSAAGTELWKTDGTPAGTMMVKDLVPGQMGSEPKYLTAANGLLFFNALDGGYPKYEVFRTDGTAEGTIRLSDGLYDKPYFQNFGVGPYDLTAVGDTLYFVAYEASEGYELYRSDGTPAGTTTVSDLIPGPAGSNPNWLFELNGALLYSADDGVHGTELWRLAPTGLPIADAGGPYAVAEGATVTLSAAGSRPAPGGAPIVKYEWDFNYGPGGTFDVDATGPAALLGDPIDGPGGRLDGPGGRYVALRVTDANGESHVDTALVNITNTPPRVSISAPSSTANEGSPFVVNLSGGNDPGDDTIKHWLIAWGDGFIERVDGNPPSVSHVYGNGPNQYNITAVARDEDGTYGTNDLQVGVADERFGAAGKVVDAALAGGGWDVVVQPDGKVITVGGGETSMVVARYNADGTPDTGFGSNGRVATNALTGLERAEGVALLPDGRILVAGNRTDNPGGTGIMDWALVRYLSDGRLDPTFGAGGIARFDAGSGSNIGLRDLALQPDGKAVVAGFVEPPGGSMDFAVARFRDDGSPDATFGAGGLTLTDFARRGDRAMALTLAGGGKIVLAGSAVQSGATKSSIALARYNPDGTLDATFGTGGRYTSDFYAPYDDEATDVALRPDGKFVFVGGLRDDVTSNGFNFFGGVTADGVTDYGFGFREGIFRYSQVDPRRVAIAPDGDIVYAGTYSNAEIVVGWLTPDGRQDERYGPKNSPYPGTVSMLLPVSGNERAAPAGLAVMPDGRVVVATPLQAGAALARFTGLTPDLTVNVLNVAPTDASPGPDRTVPEGTRVSLVGQFTDGSFAESWTYRWHVTSSNGQAIPDGTARTFEFVPADNGTYTVAFTVTDDAGASSTGTAVVTVTNVAPTASAGPDRNGFEANVMNVPLEPPHDAGAADTVTLHWSVTRGSIGGPEIASGDGLPVAFLPPNDGLYYLTVTATDDDGASSSDTAVITVDDLPASLGIIGAGAVFLGDPYTLSLSATDPSAEDSIRGWSIDWGDGEQLELPADATSATHTYRAAGTYAAGIATSDATTQYATPHPVKVLAAPGLAVDGTLSFSGTNDHDTVIVTTEGPDESVLAVTIDNARRTYDRAAVSRIVADLLDGYDVILFAGRVPSATVTMGDGFDWARLQGGAAGATFDVRGGAGDDDLSVELGFVGAATLDGGPGEDTVKFWGTGAADTLFVRPGEVSSPGRASASFTTAERLLVDTVDGDDTIHVGDTSPALIQVNLGGGTGNDTYVVGDGVTPNNWAGSFVQLEGEGGTDVVVYNDQANPAAAADYVLTAGGLSLGGVERFSHLGISRVTLNTGAAADTISIFPLATQEMTINAGAPDGTAPGDVLNFAKPLSATGGALQTTGPGGGRYTFSNFATITFSGVETLNGPDLIAPTVASSAYRDGVPQEIELRFGESLGNTLTSGDLLLTDLSTGQPVRPDFSFNYNRATPGTAVWRISGRRLAAGRYRATLRAGSVADASGNPLAEDYSFEFTARAAVSGRRVFYNNSALDGNGPAVGAADSAALANDKRALLPGQAASFANVTSYTRGINGVAVDLIGMPAGRTPTLADFQFDVSRDGRTWAAAPAPTTLVFSPTGQVTAGAARVWLAWADGTVRNTWLRVTVKATDNTQLAADDVFYFGNLVGETGDRADRTAVTTADLVRVIRAKAPGTFLGSPFDFNRDSKVTALDLLIARRAIGTSLNLITAPPAISP